MNSTAGGLAPAPAVNPLAPLLQLSNVARVMKGKVFGKKKKKADGSGSFKPSRKRLAGHVTAAAAPEAPASSLVEPLADVQKVFEEMHQSVNDEAYMSTMGVGSNNSHWSQTNDMHFDDHEFEVDEDGKGIVDAPKGRGSNYTNDEDILLCNTWLQVSRDPYIEGDLPTGHGDFGVMLLDEAHQEFLREVHDGYFIVRRLDWYDLMGLGMGGILEDGVFVTVHIFVSALLSSFYYAEFIVRVPVAVADGVFSYLRVTWG
ncbi:putative receptor protein kinase ZmPK1 [Hordeum vulgare]|nr:putative receptor protein kinase ZmPK1 [Hordeum vulgare]